MNKVGRCGTSELGICGKSMMRTVRAADTRVVEVSCCRHLRISPNKGVWRIWWI